MSTAVWPHVYGLDWKVKKIANYGNIVGPSATPGYESRLSLGPDVIYKLTLAYTLLRKGYLAQDELSIIEGFFEAQQGRLYSFLIDIGAVTSDPAESSVTGQVLTADSNSCAPIVRTKPGTSTDELMYEVKGVGGNPGSAPVIYKDAVALTPASGSPLTGDYVLYSAADTDSGVLDANGIAYNGVVVQFLSSMAGHTITADFGWYYRMRFAEDLAEFDMFRKLLWKAQQIDLVGTRV